MARRGLPVGESSGRACRYFGRALSCNLCLPRHRLRGLRPGGAARSCSEPENTGLTWERGSGAGWGRRRSTLDHRRKNRRAGPPCLARREAHRARTRPQSPSSGPSYAATSVSFFAGCPGGNGEERGHANILAAQGAKCLRGPLQS